MGIAISAIASLLVAQASGRSAESGKITVREWKTVLLLIAMVPLLAAAQPVDERFVAFPLQASQKSFDVPGGDAQLRCGLRLRDQLLLGFLSSTSQSRSRCAMISSPGSLASPG